MTWTGIQAYLDAHFAYSGSLDDRLFLQMQWEEDGGTISDDALRLTTFSHTLPTVSALVLCPHLSMVPELPPHLQSQLVFVETDMDVFSFGTELQHWMAGSTRAKEVSVEMYQLLWADDYLETLLDIAYGYFKNPISVIDHAHKIVCARQEAPLPFARWNAIGDSQYYAQTYMDDLFYSEYQRVIQTEQVHRYTFAEGPTDYYLCAALSDGVYMGVVVLIEFYKSVDAHDLTVLKTIADIVAMKSSQAKNRVHDVEEHSHILYDLINSQIKNSAELDLRCKLCRWTRASNLLVMLLAPQQTPAGDCCAKLSHNFATLYPNVKTVILKHYVLVLLEQDMVNRIPQEVDGFCKRYQVSIGFSQPFADLLQLPTYYKQAKKALELGSRYHPTALWHHYCDYWLEDVSATLTTSDVDFYPHPILAQLRAYDQNNDTDFSTTFYTYIAQDRSIAKTSELLHQHRNTVNHRIHRIKELFAVDLDDFKTLFHIYLSYQLDMHQRLR